MALLLLHHVKMSGLRRFHQGNRTAVVMECLSIPVGRAPHERDARGGENKEGERFPAGIWTVQSHHSFAFTITSCTQRYVASRPEPS